MTDAISSGGGPARRMSAPAVPERRRRVSEACRELEPATPFGFDQLPTGASEPTASAAIKHAIARMDRPPPPPPPSQASRLVAATTDRPELAADPAASAALASAKSVSAPTEPGQQRPHNLEAAAHIIEADGIVVCLDKSVGKLLHGFDTRARPFSQRSLLPVPVAALGGDLATALAVLHRSPSPVCRAVSTPLILFP